MCRVFPRLRFRLCALPAGCEICLAAQIQDRGEKRKICHALNLRAFPAGALRPQLSRGRSGAPPRGWWPSGRASVSEAGGPGLGSPWRAPCFARPCRSFWLPGVFSWLRRGFLLPADRNRGAASEVASRSAIARLFPYYSSCYKNLLLKLFPASRDKQLRPTT